MTFKDEFVEAIKGCDVYFKEAEAVMRQQEKEVGELLSYTSQVNQFRDLAGIYSSIHADISAHLGLQKEYTSLKTRFSELMKEIDSLTFIG